MTKEIEYDNDVAIIGGGPCGVAALLYLRQAGYSCCLYEPDIVGGQPRYTSTITNQAGFEGTGEEFADLLYKQVEDLDKKEKCFSSCKVTNIIRKYNRIEVQDDCGGLYWYKAVIIASGAKPKKIKNLEKYNNVHYCSLCDGPLYEGQEVVIFGGGNSAFTEGIHLANICKKVSIVCIQESGFTATKDLQEEFFSKDNCKGYLYTHYTYDENSKELFISNKVDNSSAVIKADGIFVSIGREANADFIDCEKNNSCIIVNKNYKVKRMSGVYAGGDVIDKEIKQISTAIADGVIISQEIIKYLRSKVW